MSVVAVTTCCGRWDHARTSVPSWAADDQVTRVVVVDHGCPDESGRRLEQLWAERHPEASLTVVHLPRRGDFHKLYALNAGLREVVGGLESHVLFMDVDDVLTGFIRRAELARDRQDQRPEKFAIGEKVDAKVTAVDRAARRLSLTVKGKEIEEEREAVKEFGTADSGASLGDILGAAIRRRREMAGEE